MRADAPPRPGTGAALLLLSFALGWASLYGAQAVAMPLILKLIGPERAATSAPAVETLFSLVVYGPLLLIGLIGGAIERRNAAALGRRPGAAAAIGLVMGVAGLTISVAYARFAGALAEGQAPSSALPVLAWGAVVIAAQVFGEEVYIRGWLQPALARRWGVWPALVAGAVVFAALHIAGGARAPVSLLNLFAGGLVFGLLAARGGGLATAIAAHWGWNASEELLWGLDPNPGAGSFGAAFDHDLIGRAIWGGSADGLNGSIGMTVSLLAILLPLVLLGRGAGAISPTGSPGSGRSDRARS